MEAQHTLSWKSLLAGEKEKPYFQRAMQYVKQRRAEGITVYPPQSNIFNALKYTPFDQVKVVIIGQDPYHGHNQAHGLCFSVQPHVAIPPSLQNIFKELKADIGIKPPAHGCLTHWAKQGVFLLNATLTVEAGSPQSHANIGWQIFTDRLIQLLNEKKEGLIFLLWGSYAQRKSELIDPISHYILTSTHPSPLSAHRGFLGCRHFSRTNELLNKMGKTPIDWSIQ